ncbi:MAG: response regulator [Caulobacterales bacterium]
MAVILIVEDEAFIREMAELMLQDFGHQTLSASDTESAILVLRSPRVIDALFTDIYLKTAMLGGCELGIQAIELRPELRVLYTSGNSISATMQSMFVDGKHFLSKPYTPNQLQRSVEDLLAA